MSVYRCNKTDQEMREIKVNMAGITSGMRTDTSAHVGGAGPGPMATLSVSGPGGPITMLDRMAPIVGPLTTAPADPGAASKGPLVYEWQAQGSPELKYTVQISTNGGKDWNTVAIETRQHNIAIDPSWIQGATTLDVRIRASDGIHETVATSKQLDLGAKIPLQ